MSRIILSSTERASRVAALSLARAAGVRADIKEELEGVLSSRDYTPPVITTATSIANAAVDPDIVVTLVGDTFEAAIAASDITFAAGTTALTLNSVTRDSATQITLGCTGTAVQGTLTAAVKASGLVTSPYLASNTISVTVPAP